MALPIASLRVRSVASPVEQIADTNRHHLYVTIVDGERVIAEEGGSCRNTTSQAGQLQKIVLHLPNTVGRKSPFNSPADQPAGIAVITGTLNRYACSLVGDGKIAVAYESAASFAVKERAVPRDTQPAS